MNITLPVLTVSQLNKKIKGYLEYEIGKVRVEGEISNLSKPTSGHFYFTLKDKQAQIRCVFFKNRHSQPLCRSLTDGQQVVAQGILSLYEARGDYQLIVEELTEAGLGQLYQQFEALKNKLQLEGLFDNSRKKLTPAYPKTIGLITSPSGAAVRDILSTLARRYPLAQVLIYASEVQGAGASQQLIKALQRAEKDGRCDVLILARGGGSIEDLWAFNEELLARQIAACTIPIVSGVGHETDFTIADFVADFRAETPTAAAVKVTPNAQDLLQAIQYQASNLYRAMAKMLQLQQLHLNGLTAKIASPHQVILAYWQQLDSIERQLNLHMSHLLQRRKHQLNLCINQLNNSNPNMQIKHTKVKLEQIIGQLVRTIGSTIQSCQQRLRMSLSTMHAVSPLATLDRGYAIASKKETIIRNALELNKGDLIEVRLAQGQLDCEVRDITP